MFKSYIKKEKKLKYSSPHPPKKCVLTYWINRGHGIVQEVLFFLLWGHCVAKSNVPVLLIPTVTTSTEKAGKIFFILNVHKPIEQRFIKET